VFTHARDSKDDETLTGVLTPPGTALPHIKNNLYSPENRRSMQQYTNQTMNMTNYVSRIGSFDGTPPPQTENVFTPKGG